MATLSKTVPVELLFTTDINNNNHLKGMPVISVFCVNSMDPASVVIHVQWVVWHDTTQGGETDTVQGQGADCDNSSLSLRDRKTANIRCYVMNEFMQINDRRQTATVLKESILKRLFLRVDA